MYIKIYFNDKPLFLCDSITPELEPFRHHDDAVFIDEFSAHAVNAMIHEMQQPKVHAGIFYHTDIDALKKAFWKKFTIVQAGGGLVLNPKKEILLIFRRGKWDLPKGKLDPGETIEGCAMREVEEETGLKQLRLDGPLVITHHTYHESGKFILKESHWFLMHAAKGQHLAPQHEEDISEAAWADGAKVDACLKHTYPSIVEVINGYRRQETPGA